MEHRNWTTEDVYQVHKQPDENEKSCSTQRYQEWLMRPLMPPSGLQINLRPCIWPWSLTPWPPKWIVLCLFPRGPLVLICIKVISLICLQNIVFPSLVTDEQLNGWTDNLRTMPLPCSQTGLAVALFTCYFLSYCYQLTRTQSKIQVIVTEMW